ncbi:alpha/beta hydrolase [Nonomuraea typhae]|uniref:Alpha/beta hydrolase n=1 Tax=Nonomuraea typhae TaxID=2603600 RepID=A0ABW7YM11_9ACTN
MRRKISAVLVLAAVWGYLHLINRPVNYAGQILDWAHCLGGPQCATVKVPLDHDAPGSPTLEIALARLSATDPARRMGTLVVNYGGPGISSVAALAEGPGLFTDLRERYDIVAFDPRGAGSSTALVCRDDGETAPLFAADQTPETPQEQARFVAAQREQFTQCERRSGWLMPHLTTRAAANDLDIIRSALGEERLTYLGWSYGGQLGADYSRAHPARVGRMVLDSPAAGAIGAYHLDSLLGGIRAMQDAFDAFTRDCVKRRRGCPLGKVFLDPAVELDNIIDDLDFRPLAVKGGQLDDSRAILGIVGHLYDTDSWPDLREAVRALMRGDGQPLYDAAVAMQAPGEIDARLAVNCADTPARIDPQRIVKDGAAIHDASDLFGSWIAWDSAGCQGWPANPGSDPWVPPSTPPILLVGTTEDPITSYGDAQFLKENLANATLLKVEGKDHTAYGNNHCAKRAIEGYLFDGTMPARPC